MEIYKFQAGLLPPIIKNLLPPGKTIIILKNFKRSNPYTNEQ